MKKRFFALGAAIGLALGGAEVAKAGGNGEWQPPTGFHMTQEEVAVQDLQVLTNMILNDPMIMHQARTFGQPGTTPFKMAVERMKLDRLAEDAQVIARGFEVVGEGQMGWTPCGTQPAWWAKTFDVSPVSRRSHFNMRVNTGLHNISQGMPASPWNPHPVPRITGTRLEIREQL